jgi:hypothetical protein
MEIVGSDGNRPEAHPGFWVAVVSVAITLLVGKYLVVAERRVRIPQRVAYTARFEAACKQVFRCTSKEQVRQLFTPFGRVLSESVDPETHRWYLEIGDEGADRLTVDGADGRIGALTVLLGSDDARSNHDRVFDGVLILGQLGTNLGLILSAYSVVIRKRRLGTRTFAAAGVCLLASLMMTHSDRMFELSANQVPALALLTLAILSVCLPRRGSESEWLCRQCRYNLRGNESGICPECGTPITSHRQLGPAGRR